MKFRWLIPLAIFPSLLHAVQNQVSARVITVTISPNEVTVLHLRPEFESSIRMPEEITSVILGSPGTFKAEHNEGEPDYVYIKPVTKEPAQSNLLVATKSGAHVTLELISDGASASAAQPVDFLLEYRGSRSFLIGSDAALVEEESPKKDAESSAPVVHAAPGVANPSVVELEFSQQERVSKPAWTKWTGKQIETSVGDIRQWSNQTIVSYSIYNDSSQPVEIVPPQIQMAGRQVKKKKEGKGIISDQLEIREYRLSATRIEPGGRADGLVVFDRPNFKQSNEKLFLQLAQADQVDQPILIRLPFTPPIANAK
jgi:hypothetical protein